MAEEAPWSNYGNSNDTTEVTVAEYTPGESQMNKNRRLDLFTYKHKDATARRVVLSLKIGSTKYELIGPELDLNDSLTFCGPLWLTASTHSLVMELDGAVTTEGDWTAHGMDRFGS